MGIAFPEAKNKCYKNLQTYKGIRKCLTFLFHKLENGSDQKKIKRYTILDTYSHFLNSVIICIF